MNFRTNLQKIETCQVTLKNVSWKISENFRENITEFSENFRQSWSRHIINCLLIGLALAVPDLQALGLASSGCMKDLRLVNPDKAL